MSNLVYPSLPGLMFPIQRTILPPPVQVRTTLSQREYRARDATQPRYQYSLPYEFLRANTRGAELATLVGFYNQVGGPFDSWLFTDPDDHAATAQQFGVGTGAATQFQLVRSFGGFAEPVDALPAAPTVWAAGVQQFSTPRENLITQSDFSTGPWWTRATDSTLPNSALTVNLFLGSPPVVPAVGTTGALYKLDGSYAGSATYSLLAQDVTGLVPGRAYTFSIYLYGLHAADTVTVGANGIVSGSPATLVHSNVAVVQSAWTRYSVTFTATSSTGTVFFGLSAGYSTSTTCSLYFCGPQLERADLWATPATYVATGPSGPATAPADFSVDLNTARVTFSTAPTLGAALTWTGGFYRRCRFLGDKLDTSKFMADMFDAKKVDFISTKA